MAESNTYIHEFFVVLDGVDPHDLEVLEGRVVHLPVVAIREIHPGLLASLGVEDLGGLGVQGGSASGLLLIIVVS